MGSVWTDDDIPNMLAALVQADAAARADEVPVGAIVVAGGIVIGAGHNCSVSQSDPCGHAEVIALRTAAESAGNYRLPEATLYVTLEPCVMCVGAIAQARIARVVFGAYDSKAGALGSVVDLSDSKAINHRFEVNGGLLAEESGALLKKFFEERR